jgi:hypothetical protein
VAGLVAGLWQWRRADFNVRAEARQHERAESNFQNTRAAIDRMFIRVADELAYRAAHDLRVQVVSEQPDNVWLQNTLAHVRTYLVELPIREDSTCSEFVGSYPDSACALANGKDQMLRL